MPDYAETLGPEVAAIATLAGFAPDPEQQLVLDAAFSIDRHGKSAAFEVAVIAPRQNMKTGFFKQAALGQLFVRKERLVVFSAHEFDTAQEALIDIEALIDASDQLRRRVQHIKHGAAPEIKLLPKFGGARLKFKTRTSGGGRGLSGRKVFLDEAYALQPGQVGALFPIMMAQPDPQVFYGSSACRPESSVLYAVIKRGRRGTDPRLAYFEWCAPPPEESCDRGNACDHRLDIGGCGCDKQEILVSTHSAITRGRILLQTVKDLRNSMPAAEYGREVMGWHDEPDIGVAPIDPVRWAACADKKSSVEVPVAIGLEVNSDETAAALAVCGARADGLRHGEISGTHETGHEILDYRLGTAWVVPRLVEMAGRNKPCVLVLDPSSTAGSLVPALVAAGFVKVTSDDSKVQAGKWRLYLIGAREYAQACGAIAGEIRNNTFRHIDQVPLNTAVDGTRTRPLADAYAWSRKDSSVDIAPFVALTLARHGHVLFADADKSAPFFIRGN